MIIMQKKLICVLCGKVWNINNKSNMCENPECSGFCSWGYNLNEPIAPISINMIQTLPPIQ
jgi:hypothetical protein